MANMSKAQRTAILNAHEHKGRLSIIANTSTRRVIRREGWAWINPTNLGLYPNRAGLIAAGVDLDAIHAEALAEDFERGQALAAAAPAHVRSDCPALPVGCPRCTAPATVRLAQAIVATA